MEGVAIPAPEARRAVALGNALPFRVRLRFNLGSIGIALVAGTIPF
jgi:hypothetical protein